jgi:REP element-mobilizing transposase RayT
MKYFINCDELLVKAIDSPLWLKDDKIAEIVSNKIFEFENLKYELIVFCIMPNHVHFVIHPDEDLKTEVTNIAGKTKDYVIADNMRLIKGSTARDANLILNRSGSFWQHESYDHIVRNETELKNLILYILNDPVREGFVNDWKDWKWSYCKYDI